MERRPSALGLSTSPFHLGATCEVVLAPCAPSPCRNGGACKESEDYESFSCICPTGWQGEASWPCGPAWVPSPGAGGSGSRNGPDGVLPTLDFCNLQGWGVGVASQRALPSCGVSPVDCPRAEEAPWLGGWGLTLHTPSRPQDRPARSTSMSV